MAEESQEQGGEGSMQQGRRAGPCTENGSQSMQQGKKADPCSNTGQH